MSNPIQHNVSLIPQPTQTTCWAAATAMLLNKTVNEIVLATPQNLLLADGSLMNYSNQADWVTGTEAYANAHGLGFAGPQTWSIAGLYSRLTNGPVVFDLLWQAGQYVSGVGSPGHMVCISGMSGNDNLATVTFNDPWPPSTGAVTTISYATWFQQVPTASYRVFWER